MHQYMSEPEKPEEYIEFKSKSDNFKINSIFKENYHKAYFDTIYNYLTNNDINMPDEIDSNEENLYSKFHNLFFVIDCLILGKYYAHDSPWKNGIYVAACDYYLQLRESLSDQYEECIDDPLCDKSRLDRIVTRLMHDNTAPYVLVCHQIEAFDCSYENLNHMKECSKELMEFEPFKNIFNDNNTDQICEILFELNRPLM